ncbi:MAG TPA: ABC transporter permease subunit [Candidatus Dormibacteraeota bacterium]
MRRRSTRPSRWFSSVYLATLRSYRVAIVGWGYGMSLIVIELIASTSALTSTAAGRASLTQIADTFAWNAAPVAVDTPAGYATFKIGAGILVMAIWPLLAASRTLRGEEESGALDVLLSVPEARVRVAVQKVAAIGTALVGMALVIAVVTAIGGGIFRGGYSFGDALLFGLNLALVCAVYGAVALLISQFTYERRRAAGLTAGVLLVSIVLDMAHRIWSGVGWISAISPVYYYNRSKPLITSYGTTWWAMVVLLALSLALSGAALALFARRDVGSVVPLPAWLRVQRPRTRVVALPAREWSLRSVYARSLRSAAAAVAWWTLGIAGFAAWMVVAVRQLSSSLGSLLASGTLRTVISTLGGGDARLNAVFLSAIFTLLPVLLMAFAVTQVARWAGDEEDGRFDLLLAAPQSRQRLILGRFCALATATIAIGAVTLGATALTSRLSGLTLDSGDLVAATLGMIPLGLLLAAIGYALAGWLRSAADTGLLSLLLAAWFLLSFVGPALHWPDAILRISPFSWFGTPLLHGLPAGVVVGFVAVAGFALAIGSLRFARKDIAV